MYLQVVFSQIMLLYIEIIMRFSTSNYFRSEIRDGLIVAFNLLNSKFKSIFFN